MPAFYCSEGTKRRFYRTISFSINLYEKIKQLGISRDKGTHSAAYFCQDKKLLTINVFTEHSTRRF